MTAAIAMDEALAVALPRDWPADYPTGCVCLTCPTCSRFYCGGQHRRQCAECAAPALAATPEDDRDPS